MAEHIRKLNYRFRYKNRTIDGVMEIDLSRFEGQYSKAQYELDSMVMTSMVPYMPRETSTFINVTRGMSAAIAGSGKVIAAAPPVGRFLYEGKVMVGERTRSAFAAKGERKVTTERRLQYSRSEAKDHWFDKAKERHGEAWIRKAKKLAGGG